MNLAKLRDQLSLYFNFKELRDLCFDLNIEFENLSGDTREEKARELVEYCFRHGQLTDLLKYCLKRRPNISWQSNDNALLKSSEPSSTRPTSHKLNDHLQPEKPGAKSVGGLGRKWGSEFNILEIDFPDPLGEDAVLTLANKVEARKSKTNDPNAGKWAKVSGPRWHNVSVEGYWSSRWRPYSSDSWHEGNAHIQLTNEWAYIHYEDHTNEYVIKAYHDKKKKLLIGRYFNVNRAFDSTPWVGVVVDNRRIDGFWKSGRWDFRR